MLTTAQQATLKAAILADGTLDAFPNNSDGAFAIAALMNLPASPDYWVWSSNVTRSAIYNTAGDGGSTWDWTTYKNQGVAEQNAWVQMFMGDSANFGQLNLRAGIGKIFVGSAAANAQRDHCLALGRRKARRIEKLFAVAVTSPPANTGNDGIAGNRGNVTNPDVLGFEGQLTYQDVEAARNG